MAAFGLSNTFIEYHVEITAKDPNIPTIYTISYSSGNRKIDLQDGLLSDFEL